MRRSLPARPELDNTFWTDSTTSSRGVVRFLMARQGGDRCFRFQCVIINGVQLRNGLTVSKANPRQGNGEVVPDCVIVTTRQQYGLPEDAVVFCSFNQLCKIDPYTFKVWMNVSIPLEMRDSVQRGSCLT